MKKCPEISKNEQSGSEGECFWFQNCPMRRFLHQGRLDPKWVDEYCKGDWESCVRFNEARDGKPHPDHMLPDGTFDDALKKGK